MCTLENIKWSLTNFIFLADIFPTEATVDFSSLNGLGLGWLPWVLFLSPLFSGQGWMVFSRWFVSVSIRGSVRMGGLFLSRWCSVYVSCRKSVRVDGLCLLLSFCGKRREGAVNGSCLRIIVAFVCSLWAWWVGQFYVAYCFTIIAYYRLTVWFLYVYCWI